MARDNRCHDRISRRNVLAGAGAAVTTGLLATKTVAADDRVQRTYGYKPQEPAPERARKERRGQQPDIEEVNYYISRAKWERVETAADACDRVADDLSDLDDTGLLTFGFVNQHDGPAAEKRVVVDWTQIVEEDQDGNTHVVEEPNVSYERVEEEAPYQITGVAEDDDARRERELEVEVRRVREQKNHYCYPYDDHYDEYWYDVPGGVLLDGSCTTCMPGWHSDYGYVLTSAGHCFDEGDLVKQGGYGWGECVNSIDSGYVDIATIDNTTSRGWDYYLGNNDGGTDEEIAGWLDWQVLKDMVDDTDESMKKQGQQTGRCRGIVQGAWKSNGIRHFETSAVSDDGDSGGPHFDIDSSGDAQVSGLHRGTYPDTDNDNARATYIDDLYDEADLYF